MKLTLTKKQLDDAADAELGEACFVPMIPLIRGKSMAVKREVYDSLNEGQQALFLFYTYYHHACKSLEEFYWWTAYSYAQPQTWDGLLRALQYWRAEGMKLVLEEMSKLFELHRYAGDIERFNAAAADLERDAELRGQTEALFAKLTHTSNDALERIGAKIRLQPDQFLELRD